MLWIVAVMNMVNFLDGLDGLAAGVCGISAATYAILALSLGKTDPAILSAIVAGACLGFLRHNFFPARIFMGDSGALTLGFLLAADLGAGALEDRVDDRALPASARPCRADPRHLVRRRATAEEPRAALGPGPVAPPFPLPPPRLLAATATMTMWAWCATLAGAALATRFIPFRAGGEWHLWETIAAVAIAFAALGFSLYVVYLLEIVKLANPRVRRTRGSRAPPPLGLITSQTVRLRAGGTRAAVNAANRAAARSAITPP